MDQFLCFEVVSVVKQEQYVIVAVEVQLFCFYVFIYLYSIIMIAYIIPIDYIVITFLV